MFQILILVLNLIQFMICIREDVTTFQPMLPRVPKAWMLHPCGVDQVNKFVVRTMSALSNNIWYWLHLLIQRIYIINHVTSQWFFLWLWVHKWLMEIWQVLFIGHLWTSSSPLWHGLTLLITMMNCRSQVCRHNKSIRAAKLNTLNIKHKVVTSHYTHHCTASSSQLEMMCIVKDKKKFLEMCFVDFLSVKWFYFLWIVTNM